jgi:Ni/Fe-hydrogenase subunit HybB-like protein
MTTATQSKRNIPMTYSILAFLTIVGIGVGIYRLAVGLGPTTNLNDYFPWGLWIGLDVFLIPAAGAAFTVSAISHFFGGEKYHEIVRPAVLVGLLGYVSVALILILDLGRWHQFYNILIPPFINIHSFLEEVALSVTLYTMVLIVEFAPVILEKFDLKTPVRWINRGILLISGVGILISTIHQSSIGSMFLILEHKLHPIWWTPLIPFLFLTQALFGGLAMSAMVVKLAQEHLGMKVDRDLLTTIGKLARILLSIYLVAKVADWIVAGELGLLFTSGGFSLLIWAELILGLALPLFLLFSDYVNRPEGVFWAGFWITVGLFINRLTYGWIALETPPWATYVPHWMEVMSSVGVLSGATLAYLLIARFFNLFPAKHEVHTS